MSETPEYSKKSASGDFQTWQDKVTFWAIAAAFGILLVFIIITGGLNIWLMVQDNQAEDTPDAEAVLERANDAVDSASLVLSFLEGASVIVAVALGAAAFYGFRETQQLRQELTDKLKDIDDRSTKSDQRLEQDSKANEQRLTSRQLEIEQRLTTKHSEIDQRLAVFDRRFEQASQKIEQGLASKHSEIDLRVTDFDTRLGQATQDISDKRNEVDKALSQVNGQMPVILAFTSQISDLISKNEKLENVLDEAVHGLKATIDNVAFLLQADQEFRNRNFKEAHGFLTKVLASDPDNLLALYIIGWIEVHHIDDGLNIGLEHLKLAVKHSQQLPFVWYSAEAAYGVGLRRKAMLLRKSDPRVFEDLMLEAEGSLKKALGHNTRLVDFNRESFWGPLGGLQRDTRRYDEAVKSYEKALETTPGSSYVQGNLAALYLRQVKYNGLDEKKALDAFENTLHGAEMRAATTPNDFFLLMDIAMSSTVLLRRDADPKKVDDAQQIFERALHMRLPIAQREVNCRGWCFLLENCPETEPWAIVRQELQARVDTMQCNCKEGE